MELTWSLDYCLACDKQTAGEPYCSQSCRLADIETSSISSRSMSPTACANLTESTQGSGFYLSPAINFATYHSPISSQKALSQPTSPSSSKFYTGPLAQTPSKKLTPSLSQSSLGSMNNSSTSQNDSLPEETRQALRCYTNSFDTTRNWRRRST